MRHVPTLLPSAVILTTLFAATTAPAHAQTGSVTHRLRYIHAVMTNGSPAPRFDAACAKQLSSSPTRFLGMPVRTSYDINPKTLMMTAVSSFPSPVPTQPLQLSVKLNPLGIKGTYAFGAFRPAPVPSASAVLFSIDTAFQASKSTFVVFGPKDQGYNCVISSDPAVKASPEASRFQSQ